MNDEQRGRPEPTEATEIAAILSFDIHLLWLSLRDHGHTLETLSAEVERLNAKMEAATTDPAVRRARYAGIMNTVMLAGRAKP